MNEFRMKMVGRGECNALQQAVKWFQEKERKKEVIERRSKHKNFFCIKALGNAVTIYILKIACTCLVAFITTLKWSK